MTIVSYSLTLLDSIVAFPERHSSMSRSASISVDTCVSESILVDYIGCFGGTRRPTWASYMLQSIRASRPTKKLVEASN